MKTLLYVQIDDDVASLYERVKHFAHTVLYFSVPKKALLFQSVINFKILKRCLEKKGNRVVIVTTDLIGMHLAQMAGLSVCRRLDPVPLAEPPMDGKEVEVAVPSPLHVEPIQARRNELTRETPRRIEKKMTLGELIEEFRKKRTKGRSASRDAELYTPASRSRLLLGVLGLAGFLFFLIGYIALPGATVFIRPRFETLTHTVNITLADAALNRTLLARHEPNVIASQTLVREVAETRVFTTSGKEFNGVNSTGFVRLMNTSSEEWTLAGGTRLQSPDGIVFRIAGAVVVPPTGVGEGGTSQPGQVRVAVTADPFDRYGEPVGARGNLPPTRFILPGLSKFNQSQVWAESTQSMTSGVTAYSRVVQEADLIAARKQIEDSLLLTARGELAGYLGEFNRQNGTRLVLLDENQYLKTTLSEVRMPDDLVGRSQDKFEVFARLTVQGVAYDFDQLFALLKQELAGRHDPEMTVRLDSIAPENVRYEVMKKDEAAGQIKITATIQGLQEYEIDTASEAGLRFSTRVKEKVLKLPLEEARKTIGNLPEVDLVEIKTWPFWVSRMPRLPENIEIRLWEG